VPADDQPALDPSVVKRVADLFSDTTERALVIESLSRCGVRPRPDAVRAACTSGCQRMPVGTPMKRSAPHGLLEDVVHQILAGEAYLGRGRVVRGKPT